MKTIEERFWAKVRKGPGCWEWTARRDPSGYGRFAFRGRNSMAYRTSWTLNCGEIPPGRMVLHTCNNRACVRPDHLYLGDQSDNMRDSMEAGTHTALYRKLSTFCRHGHPYTEQNTILIPRGRSCRACRREAYRRYHKAHPHLSHHGHPGSP